MWCTRSLPTHTQPQHQRILSPRGFSPFRSHQDNKKPWEGWGPGDKYTHCWTSFFYPGTRFSQSVMSVSLLPLSPCPLLNATCRRRRCSSFCRRCFWFPAWIMGRWEQRRRAAACPPTRPGTMAPPPRSETSQPPTWPPRGGSSPPPLCRQVNINKWWALFSRSLLQKMEMSFNRGSICDSQLKQVAVASSIIC